MMKSAKGGLAALLIEKLGSKKEDSSPNVNDEADMMEESEEEEPMVACEVCMEEFIKAIENKDASAASQALLDFLEVANKD